MLYHHNDLHVSLDESDRRRGLIVDFPSNSSGLVAIYKIGSKKTLAFFEY